ncbi:BQ5605_C004g02610 [Microbotryum silenes-dioicae]|uniref:BQ5605_C004g02610 protein n=1 Tax=Microbotryum silenes-dioicae TaxID=796604 RepID=A0A2X0M883_9BASI|nr:BQ5605_C004g02610 [Microbotryum silenes-dioicae]
MTPHVQWQYHQCLLSLVERLVSAKLYDEHCLRLNVPFPPRRLGAFASSPLSSRSLTQLATPPRSNLCVRLHVNSILKSLPSMSSRNSATIDWRGCAEQAEGDLELQQLEAERDLACAQRDVLQARVAALETANESIRGRNEYLENRDRVKVEHGNRKRVLNTTQPSNNDNHTEHLSTDPTCLKLQNELQVYVRQEAIKDHLHLMKLDDSKDDPEVNINTAALREVKIEAAHGAMAKIEQRSNGAVKPRMAHRDYSERRRSRIL